MIVSHLIFFPGPNETPLIRTTGHFAPREQRFVHHAITFRSRQTYVALPTLQAFQSTSIYFQLKTRERDALLLYNAGREADFLAVELVAGHVQVRTVANCDRSRDGCLVGHDRNIDSVRAA